jgi:hypothetical protein
MKPICVGVSHLGFNTLSGGVGLYLRQSSNLSSSHAQIHLVSEPSSWTLTDVHFTFLAFRGLAADFPLRL